MYSKELKDGTNEYENRVAKYVSGRKPNHS
ncbi:MAG: hypothetical protein ACI9IA_002119 [Enterobacterales bacterium]|jgi:hypothetical protein